MASVCACGEYFEINDEGELCLTPGTMGLRETVQFDEPGAHQFVTADYPWLARVRVRVQGAGGGSAGAKANQNELISRPGGGGGGYSESLLDASALGAVESVVVGTGGAGGAGNSPGASGGGSSFGGVVTAMGGRGGGDGMVSDTTFTTSNGVSPLGLGTGQITNAGGPGEGSLRLEMRGLSGKGGDSTLGFGGYGRSTSGPGTEPSGAGGGAGGAFSADGNSYNGAAGGDGLVIVELYG
ncbi:MULTISPECIES: glycine-rich domain-containing protein [Streptomyces]|uniref:Glycine-rich domain-containing protein n=1 Tax=Streptomyces flavovirens TaxID=52258 RepID=A0ABV8NAY1_9ACTN|nr:hypothetical protein [Streptomyces sp. MBT51]MBK3592430.1 hypothetical protein [Streptomyces sp. MBT51]